MTRPHVGPSPALQAPGALRDEHCEIEAMLSVLDAAARRLAAGGRVDHDILAGLTRFFTRFVTASHQAKERRLLEALAAGVRCHNGSQALLLKELAEHAYSRVLLGRLSDGVRRLAIDASDRGPFIQAAREYASALRACVEVGRAQCDRAAGLLKPEDDERLVRAFEEIEREGIGPTGREWYRQVVADYRDIVATWEHPPHRDHPARS